MPGKTEMVLRIPIHGFAKRADDTAARAMAVLRAKDNSNPKKSSSMPEHPTKGKVARDGSHRSSLYDFLPIPCLFRPPHRSHDEA